MSDREGDAMALQDDFKYKLDLFRNLREVEVKEVGFFGRSTIWQVGSKKIYVKYAKKQLQSPSEDRYFFGIKDDFLKFNTAYLLFICGTPETTILISAPLFVRLSNGVPTPQNQIKLNIFSSYGRFELSLSGKSRVDVTDYLKSTSELIKTLKGV